VELPGRPVRRGDKVRFLPERGAGGKGLDQGLWTVARVRREKKARIAELVRQTREDHETETAERDCEDLVVVAEFRDPIYPGLKSTGTVERGDDKPFHSVINAENYHTLQALLYTHEGKIDAIYIDPPYNSGAKDWKYNNDYVDGEDAYRHSKWLAMMERRLKLAKRLLNPENSVLIVTIDEKEYLRLGLLLQQAFPESQLQMVSSVINPTGTQRRDSFNRTDEYLYFLRLGEQQICPEVNQESAGEPLDWQTFRLRNASLVRSSRPNQFYAIFVNKKDGTIVGRSDALGFDVDRASITPPPGCEAVFPIRPDGTEMLWAAIPEEFSKRLANGYIRAGKRTPKQPQAYIIQYLRSGSIAAIEGGQIAITGRADDGSVIGHRVDAAKTLPTTQWNRASHNAQVGGTRVLKSLMPDRRFPFPKSLYAVEDALRFFVADKPNAVVLDFFSGSGTTCHAVMRLNKQDSGRRQCISVTNNEVSADEQKALRKKGLRPGDPDWEALGICDYITKPRIEAAITGKAPDGKPIKGDYKFTDEFPMADGFEENVEFFTLTYEAPRPVAHHRSFEAIAPLLWLRAGAQGRRVDQPVDDFDVADTYGVLFDLDAAENFLSALQAAPSVRTAFIVTDDDRGFAAVCRDLPAEVEAVRLYASYLTNFTINTGRD